LIFGGATVGFMMYSKYSIVLAIAVAFSAMIPGIVFLLFSEGFFTLLEILKEKKEQTKILYSIDKKLQKLTTAQKNDSYISQF